MLKAQVVYKSRTGNTEKVAQAIFEAIPIKCKDIGILDGQTNYEEGDVYFVGFWTDRGSASMEVLDFLGSLKGKKVALFGTCGMGGSPEYFKKIEENVRVFIEGDSEYLGAYLCQGKMPMAVREKYLGMKTKKNEKEINAMLRNFDMALLHPDRTDLEGAKEFAVNIFKALDHV